MKEDVDCEKESKEQELICSKKGSENHLYVNHLYMEKTGLNHSKGSKKYGVISVILALLLATAVTVIGFWRYQERKAESRIQEYTENFDVVVSLMLQGADEAGSCCSFMDQVWYNAIYERSNYATDKYTRPDGYYVSDFNEALDNLFADEDFYARINRILENQERVSVIIRKLKDPPERYITAFQYLFKLYNAYLSLTDMAVSPLGSLNTFSEDFDSADAEFTQYCQMLKIDIGHYQKNREAERSARKSRKYSENLRNVVQTMLFGAADAESCCNLIVQVWNNAICEKADSETDIYTRPEGHFVTDFNDALGNLFSDPDFCAQIDSIMENQETVNSIVGLLANPPEEYKSAYESLAKCYDAYRRFINIAVNPTGSLNTFSADFDDADKEFMRCYQAMDFYLQD